MGSFARVLSERYRCPEEFLKLAEPKVLSEDVGFFRFGRGVTCYGRSSAGVVKPQLDADLYDVSADATSSDSGLRIPFDPGEIVDNLRLERYPGAQDSWLRAFAREAYYAVRPILSPSVRREIQRFQLRGSRGLTFPNWPVDRTVEDICDHLLLCLIKETASEGIPFIWFWPEGKRSCAIMTHDVDSKLGRDLCADLMDIDDSFGIKASFQIVPERCYSVSMEFLSEIRSRGFEIAVQDLNHDGLLFSERKEFLRRAKIINQYARAFDARGFRGAVLYRRPEWMTDLDFSFDMSIPNVAHLDPQRGGCCTIMPYLIGELLELPVTTTQDYMLFHLLNERSIDLWKTQIELITERNGLISFIVHPDYAMADEVKPLYKDLLRYLRETQTAQAIWLTLPSEVERWWRARNKMELVFSENEWRVQGEGSERAVVAFARQVDGKLVYQIESDVPKPSRHLSMSDIDRLRL